MDKLNTKAEEHFYIKKILNSIVLIILERVNMEQRILWETVKFLN